MSARPAWYVVFPGGARRPFQNDLEPGQYLVLCTMAEDEGRHYELGMIDRFTID